jgi:nucleoside 2-deoxyribosyltransferase
MKEYEEMKKIYIAGPNVFEPNSVEVMVLKMSYKKW